MKHTIFILLNLSCISSTDAPEFKNGNESKEVLQGENVTLSCSADSNPPSNIRWIYTAAVNSNVTTEGQQKTITITGITSANAGIYICVAENEAGRNTRFVSLVIKGMITFWRTVMEMYKEK